MPHKVSVRQVVAVLSLVLLSGVGTGHAGDQVPYKDRVFARILAAEPLSVDTVRLPFEVVVGHGTLVGRFTSLGELTVDLNTLLFTGSNTLRAANGDRVFIDITGGLTPTTDPETFVIAVETTFVGGTGRFQGATGGFVGEGQLVLGPGGAFAGSTFVGVGEGTISSPGAGKK